ncbi:MAG: hypothetical protein GY903_28825 [Fuerstiella sp.]|nr:hypothetical protein [Fuerstiella sp.]MCP4858499.1 hypothetical protein [Fuerstiella sp.]
MNSDQFFYLLIQQVWQIVALTIFVWLLVRLLGRHRPHLAHGLWLIVVLKCVTPPIWGHSLGVFSQVQTALAAMKPAKSERIETPAIVTTFNDMSLKSETIDALSRGRLIDESDSEFGAFAPPISGRLAGVVPRQHIGTTLWGVLAGGALLGLLVVTARFATCVRRIQYNRVRDSDDELNEHLAYLCRKLRIRHVPDIVVSDVLFGPAVLGIFRHTIVLPKCLLQTEPPGRTVTLASLNPILAHELLHIRRGDLFTGALQTVVQCLWWFHPAVWFANRMLSRDAERCCDEQVIAELGCGPAEYARSLLSVIESKQPLQAVPVFPGMKPVEITFQRMERIMSLKHGSHKRMPLWNWAIVLGFGLLVLPGAASQNYEATTAPPVQRAAQLTESADALSPLTTPDSTTTTTGNAVQQLPKAHAPDDSAGAQQLQPERKLVPMVYNVADLVASIPKIVGQPDDSDSAVVQANGDSALESTRARPRPAPPRIRPISHNGRPEASSHEVEYDFAPLVELIRTSVATDTWAMENGPGRIEPNSKTLSIVVRQTPEAHDEIVDLLSALRKEHDMLVMANSLIVQLPENQESDWLDQAIKLNPSADGLRWALATKSRTEKLLDFVREGGGQVLSCPQMTTLPGHTAEISVSSGDKDGQPSGVALSLTARPLSDGDLLRLDYRIAINEPLKHGTRGTGLLKSGQTLVVEYTAGNGVQVGVPLLGDLPHADRLFRNTTRHSGPYLITITPRLVRAVVEEALVLEKSSQ